ncbi:MAG TPA: lactate utilization protein C [Burkholderiales bacterium]|nr:lactate utilization protein C [Burkholderiales bacterium]
MTSDGSGARDRILSRIRKRQEKVAAPSAAEREGLRSHIHSHPLSPRPAMAWDPVARFREQALRLASTIEEVTTLDGVPAAAARYLKHHGLPLVAVCWPQFADLPWRGAGLEVESRAARDTDPVGVTGVFCAIAETGTLMTLSGAGTPATVSLLPETHIAIVPASRIVRGMEEAWQLARAELGQLPRAVNFISGPSRTADIEQTVTVGAHGPYRVHIVLLA